MTLESDSSSTMPAPEPASAAHRYSKHIIVGLPIGSFPPSSLAIVATELLEC